jgi:regulator of RNase E activity RraA
MTEPSDRLPFTAADLDVLRQWDTPTICNALEVLAPQRRSVGFTTEPLVCLDPAAPPIVGLARVGTIRAREAPRGPVADRLDWYDYVADAELPTVVVIQDVDDRPGYGAFWGEVHSTVHRSLGALGCVTNGSFRDVGDWAPGFQMLGGRIGPSHAFVHVVDFGRPVNVAGMQVGHDDVVHADVHGAVVVPAELVTYVAAAVELVARREAVILDVCRAPGFSPQKLREAVTRSGDIH